MLAPLAIGLLLVQLPPPRLARPWLLDGTEPGTRLLPFGEAEPSRGPLAPPKPLGPPPPTAQEWRELSLARARSAGLGDSGLGQGPKDPWHAVALSAEGLLAGLLFPPLLTVGPSAGQAYAGNWKQAAVTSSIRTVFVAAIAVAAVWFASQATSGRVPAGQLASDATIVDGVTLLSGAGIALTSAFDIATAYQEAWSANLRWEASVPLAR
ncbi:MAG: hypothetical protein ACYDCL_09545 [Myxococcales bacterium]